MYLTRILVAALLCSVSCAVVAQSYEPKSNTPEQMLQLAKADAAKIDKIVRTAGIKAE